MSSTDAVSSAISPSISSSEAFSSSATSTSKDVASSFASSASAPVFSSFTTTLTSTVALSMSMTITSVGVSSVVTKTSMTDSVSIPLPSTSGIVNGVTSTSTTASGMVSVTSGTSSFVDAPSSSVSMVVSSSASSSAASSVVTSISVTTPIGTSESFSAVSSANAVSSDFFSSGVSVSATVTSSGSPSVTPASSSSPSPAPSCNPLLSSGSIGACGQISAPVNLTSIAENGPPSVPANITSVPASAAEASVIGTIASVFVPLPMFGSLNTTALSASVQVVSIAAALGAVSSVQGASLAPSTTGSIGLDAVVLLIQWRTESVLRMLLSKDVYGPASNFPITSDIMSSGTRGVQSLSISFSVPTSVNSTWFAVDLETAGHFTIIANSGKQVLAAVSYSYVSLARKRAASDEEVAIFQASTPFVLSVVSSSSSSSLSATATSPSVTVFESSATNSVSASTGSVSASSSTGSLSTPASVSVFTGSLSTFMSTVSVSTGSVSTSLSVATFPGSVPTSLSVATSLGSVSVSTSTGSVSSLSDATSTSNVFVSTSVPSSASTSLASVSVSSASVTLPTIRYSLQSIMPPSAPVPTSAPISNYIPCISAMYLNQSPGTNFGHPTYDTATNASLCSTDPDVLPQFSAFFPLSSAQDVLQYGFNASDASLYVVQVKKANVGNRRRDAIQIDANAWQFVYKAVEAGTKTSVTTSYMTGATGSGSVAPASTYGVSAPTTNGVSGTAAPVSTYGVSGTVAESPYGVSGSVAPTSTYGVPKSVVAVSTYKAPGSVIPTSTYVSPASFYGASGGVGAASTYAPVATGSGQTASKNLYRGGSVAMGLSFGVLVTSLLMAASGQRHALMSAGSGSLGYEARRLQRLQTDNTRGSAHAAAEYYKQLAKTANYHAVTSHYLSLDPNSPVARDPHVIRLYVGAAARDGHAGAEALANRIESLYASNRDLASDAEPSYREPSNTQSSPVYLNYIKGDRAFTPHMTQPAHAQWN
ncbi:hypothetical protein BC830DRAFT_1234477, partial [Chytriomyces sp. MP71]